MSPAPNRCYLGALQSKKIHKSEITMEVGGLKVVGYYDLRVLSMSVMGFQKSLDGAWVGGVSSIQVFFGFFEFVLTLQSPLHQSSIVFQWLAHRQYD